MRRQPTWPTFSRPRPIRLHTSCGRSTLAFSTRPQRRKRLRARRVPKWIASFLRLHEFTQRIADNNSLPTEPRHRDVVALGKIAPLVIRGKEVVRADARAQVWLIGIARHPGDALVDQVGNQSLRRTFKEVKAVRPGSICPI